MRGSLAVITAALITLLALTSLLTYVSTELRRLPQQYSRYGYSIQRHLESSVKDLTLTLTNDGLMIRTLNPPVAVRAILNITSSGIRVLLNNTVINTLSAKLLDYKDVVDTLANGGYLVVITEGRRYFILDRSLLVNSSPASMGSSLKDLDIDLRLNYLRPVLYVGIPLKDSFIDNPIPGLPSDPEANYLPVGYSLITSDSHTISRGEWYLYIDPRSNPNKLGITYGSGSTRITYLGMGYYRLESQHSVYVKWYELVSNYDRGWYIWSETIASGTACMYIYPIVISGNSSVNLVYYLENLGNYVSLNVRPFLYVVSVEDWVKGLPLLPNEVNPVPEPVIRYPVIRPLYTWEGSKVVANMRSGDHVSVNIPINAQSILNYLGVSRAVALVGIRFSTTSGLNVKLTTFITEYNITFTITNDEVGKYLIVPSSTNLIPEVISPSKTMLLGYRPSNIVSSVVKYPVLFIPNEAGTYVIRYRLGNYYSIPELRAPVNLTGNPSTPQITYLRNQHLGWVNYVVNDLITLEPNNAVLRDHEYFSAGSETYYSGDLIIVSNVPTSGVYNLSYYVNSLVQGVRTLNVGQNTTFDLYYCWSSWSCYYYWRINVSFTPDNQGYRMRVAGDVLWHSGSYYLKFGVDIILSNAQVVATPSISNVKYSYRLGSTPYLLYVASTYAELVRLNNLIMLT